MLHQNSSFHGLELPRDDVRMMLHLCDDHLIALFHLRLTERTGHQIDSLCRTSREDYLLYLIGIDKLAQFFTCFLMQISSLLREVMHPTMHIGIHIEILIAHRIEHTQRLLRGSRVVEIHQRFSINLTSQYREILTYFVDVVHILSFTEFTACALVEFASESFLYKVVETITKRFELHVIDDLIDESVLQEEFSLSQRDASLTHIEEGCIVELTYR